MTRKLILLFLLVLLGAGCASPAADGSVATATTSIITLTLPAAPTVGPSQTPLPPPPQPTMAPIEGTTSTQINVRAEPSTASNVLGIIPASSRVEVVGKDPGGNWLQIIYPQGVDGKGWVTAQYVVTAAGTEVPVIGGGQNPNDGNVAIVQQQLNVRSGPGTGFSSLGTLNPQDVVHLVGKDANGTWLQIEYSSGPDGKGWVNAAFVQAKGVENIPIITEAGEVIGTGTPTGIPATPTPTVIPAWDDNDSPSQPGASVVFERLGTHTLIYSGDVSAPAGDAQDWIQFSTDGDVALVSFDCTGANELQLSILENGNLMLPQFACNEESKAIEVKAGTMYLIEVRTPQFSGGVQYFQYTITIQASP